MITHHQNSVFLFNGGSISTLADSKNKLSLSSIHSLIKTTWIHSKRIQILFSTNISITTYKTFNTQMINELNYLNLQQLILFRYSFFDYLIYFNKSCLNLFNFLFIIIMAINLFIHSTIYIQNLSNCFYTKFIKLFLYKIYQIQQILNTQIPKYIKHNKPKQVNFQIKKQKFQKIKQILNYQPRNKQKQKRDKQKQKGDINKVKVRDNQMIQQSLQVGSNDESIKEQQNQQMISIQQKVIATQRIVSSLNEQNLKRQQSNQSNIKKTCSNKICSKYKPQTKSKQSAFNPQDLCKQCLNQYKKEAYCLYCKQIYFDSSDDGKQWILCQSCGRWVHSQCANYDNNYQQDFKCIKCKKNQPLENPATLLKKLSTKLNSNGNGNPKTTERRKLTQCSLNNFGFYWQLAPSQHAQDMDKIRQFLQ